MHRGRNTESDSKIKVRQLTPQGNTTGKHHRETPQGNTTRIQYLGETNACVILKHSLIILVLQLL